MILYCTFLLTSLTGTYLKEGTGRLPEAVLAITPGRSLPTQTRAWPTQTKFCPKYTTPVGLPKISLAL